VKKLTAWCVSWTSVWFVALVVVSCHAGHPSVTPVPAVGAYQLQCQAACDNMHSLGCEEGNPIGMGTACRADVDCLGPNDKPDRFQTCALDGTCMITCTSFCAVLENAGAWLDPACAAQVVSCDQLQQCPASKPTGTSCTSSSCTHGK
jgi:hypothetical protein